MSTKEYNLRKLKKEMDIKELDRLTNEKFKGSISELFKHIHEPALVEHKLRSRMINLITKGRKTMLHKVIKIVALNSKGNIEAEHELTDITFAKNDAMAVLPSRVIKDMLKEVDKGGAIFIEKVWNK